MSELTRRLSGNLRLALFAACLASALCAEPTDDQLRMATQFASQTGLPPGDVQRMTSLLEDLAGFQHTSSPTKTRPEIEKIAPFLVRWVRESKALRPAQQAAALYAADVYLAWLPLTSQQSIPYEQEKALSVPLDLEKKWTERWRNELGTVGAQFKWSELGDTYQYQRDWLQEAFRIAPESEAGQQAFLVLLHASFNPGCCCPQGEGFEEVIRRAPGYLQEHPNWSIRADVLAAIGDAYRDIIATANGANGDPFGDATRYKGQVKSAYGNALHYYQAAIAAKPGSEAAKHASAQAKALKAGVAPQDTTFVCIYD